MRRNRYPRTRPEDFRLNADCQLAQGLMFLGAGRFAQSTRFHDSSLYGNHGTLTNMAVPATPTSGWTWDNYLGRWATHYDGTDDHAVLLTSAIASPPFSIAAYFKATDLLAARTLLSFGKTNDVFCEINLQTTGILRALSSVAAGQSYATTTTAAAAGISNHVVACFDAIDSRQIYLNGGASGTENTSRDTSNLTSTYIGAKKRTALSQYWFGQLSDMLIWARALSAAEIAALADPSNVMLSGLLLPPRRWLFSAAAAGGATIRWPWQQRRHRRYAGVS